MLSLIAAMDRNRLIGSGNALPWRLSEDMKWFKRVTMDKPIVMGRKTHESIGRPLPGRRNIIVSRNPGYAARGCECVTSLEQALELTAGDDEVMVIGGAQLYRKAMPYAKRMYLTLIDAAFEGDTWFPDYARYYWHELERQTHRQTDGGKSFDYHFVVLERANGV